MRGIKSYKQYIENKLRAGKGLCLAFSAKREANINATGVNATSVVLRKVAYRKALKFCASAFALATLCGGAALFMVETPAVWAEGEIRGSNGLNLSVTINQAIAIRTLDSTATTPISELDFSITPTPTGVRQTNTTVVDVATSNVSGYRLTMSAETTDTNLTNTDATIAATDAGIIATAAGNASASATSYWNYNKSWNETLGPDGYTKDFSSSSQESASLNNLAIPSSAAPATIRDDVDIATSSSKTNIDINVNVATDKSSGIYRNNLLFTAIANPIPVDYTLTFNKNTTDTVTNLPDPLTATAVATSYNFTIPDVSGSGTLPAMTRSGYQFAGWSTDPNTRQGSGSGPNGLYIAGDTYTVLADDQQIPDYTSHGTGSSTLYAFWDVKYNYTLNFSCGTGATNCPATQTDSTTATTKTFTIPSTTPEMEGYIFVNYTDNGAGAGNTYDPGDTITLTSTANTKTLTANWEEDASDFWGITTMQEMTWEVCQSVHYPNSTTSTSTSNLVTDKATYESKNITSDGTTQWVPTRTLIDDRDADGTGTKRSYTVSRLADGNCWMTENLKYDLRGLYNNGKRGIGSKNDGSTFEMTDSSFASGVSGYYTTTSNAYNYVINPNTKSISTTMTNSQLGNKTDTQYYYNWTGATAGQGSQTQSSGDINGSICPAGWRLPANYTDTTNQNVSWSALTQAYLGITENTSTTTGYQTLEKYPLAFYRSGRLYSGSQGNAAGGCFWSSTAYPSNANIAYNLFFNTSNVFPQGYSDKYFGFQVRCVASRSV